jgi:ADP-sugar diphosphatase
VNSVPDDLPVDSGSVLPDWRALSLVRSWENSLRAQGWRRDSLSPLNILRRRHGPPDSPPLFALLQAEGKDPEGKAMLPYVLLRGSASVVVPVCINRATGERRFLMVRQRRVGDGRSSLEFPAGMVDAGGDPLETAARELEEETGMRVEASALVSLWDKGLASSPGLSDEAVHFFAVEIPLDDAAYRALEGGASGHADEGEHITTTLKTYAEAAGAITSLQPLLGFFLYHRFYGEGA